MFRGRSRGVARNQCSLLRLWEITNGSVSVNGSLSFSSLSLRRRGGRCDICLISPNGAVRVPVHCAPFESWSCGGDFVGSSCPMVGLSPFESINLFSTLEIEFLAHFCPFHQQNFYHIRHFDREISTGRFNERNGRELRLALKLSEHGWE